VVKTDLKRRRLAASGLSTPGSLAPKGNGNPGVGAFRESYPPRVHRSFAVLHWISTLIQGLLSFLPQTLRLPCPQIPWVIAREEVIPMPPP
jgi:hypothetical protein